MATLSLPQRELDAAAPFPAGICSRPAPSSVLPFSPLLFRQVCLLAAIAGMAAFRYPAHGSLAWLLLALFTLRDADRRKILLFTAAFAAGCLFAFATANAPLRPTELPGWVRAATTPDGKRSDERYADGAAVAGTVLENTALAGRRSRLVLGNVHATGESDPLPGNLVLTWQDPPPDLAEAGPGQKLTATLRIREIRGFANPGVWESERYWRDRGAYFRSWSKGDGTRNGKNPSYALTGEPSRLWRMRTGLRNAVLAALAGPGGDAGSITQAGAVIPALLFGDRSLCAPETLDRVARATLAHSLALSGMHMGFAAGLGYGAAYLLSFLFPSLFLRLPRQKAGILCAVPLCLCYLWIGGAPPSLVRAALMLLFWGALLWANRPKVLVDGLLWAVALILVFSPAALFDIRLQLSAVSVAGIALAGPLLGALARHSPRPFAGRLRNRLRGVLLVTAGMAVVSVAAQAAVLPLVLDAFPGTGLWFPLNLVWLPVLGMWVMPASFAGLALTASGFTHAASCLFTLAQIPCQGLFLLLEAMEGAGLLIAPVALRPAFPAMAGYWLLLLLVPAVLSARAFSRRTAALFCLGLLLAAVPSLSPTAATPGDWVRLQLIDVGQGQAALLSWHSRGERGRILVDGGGFASPFFDVGRQVVTPALTDNQAPRLDWIVNTHPDTDHLQGLLFPLAGFSVGHFATGPGTFGHGTAVKPTRSVTLRDAILRRRDMTPAIWQAGDVITLAPDLMLQVLHPGEAPGPLSANNSALVLRPVWRGRPLALLCGDLERRGLATLLRQNVPLDADVLVLPHHGSAGSFSPGLYDAVSPRLALAACGYANTWHFPAKTIVKALAARRIPLETTADRGQIAVTWDEHFGMHTSFARE